MEYMVSDEVRKVAEPLIKNFHAHLNSLDIVYLFQNKRDKKTGGAVVPRSKGKAVLGQAKLVTGLNAFLVSGATRTDGDEIDPFFVLLITKFTWDKMKAAQRAALVDHELCFPAGTLVTGPHAEASVRRRYRGEIISIRTASGQLLTATPNHPALTDHGWTSFSELRKGVNVFRCVDGERVARLMDPHEYQMPALIENVACANRVLLGDGFVPQATEDFDSDIIDSEVDVVGADGGLLRRIAAESLQHSMEAPFSVRHVSEAVFLGLSDFMKGGAGVLATPPSGLRRLSESSALSLTETGHAGALSGAASSGFDSLFTKIPLHSVTVDPARFLQEIQGRTGDVFSDQIVDVSGRSCDDHVYNFETSQEWYIANGLIVHNCHMGIDDESGRLTLLPHDVHEFNAIVRRHGLWSEDIEAFFKAAKQIPLPLPLKAQKVAVQKAEKNGNGANPITEAAPANGNGKPSGVDELKKAVRAKRGGRGAAADGTSALPAK